MTNRKNKYLISSLAFASLIAIFMCLTPTANAVERTASTPTEFSAAWNAQDTSKIVLKSDIAYGSGTTGLNNRTTDIEITGEEGPGEYGYKIALGNRSLRVNTPTTSSGKAIFKLHDIVVENNGLDTGDRGGFIADNNYVGTSASNWTFEIGNVQVPKGPTFRLARVTRGQVNLYGKMNISTQAENFYTGGMYFAEGMDYYGEITNRNFSAIWFRSSIKDGDSGNGKFEIGPRASVKLRNTGSGTTYPAVYRAYKEIIVGEDAHFTATVPGSAVQFGGTNKKFTAKKGAIVTLTSLDSYSSISTKSVTGASENVTGEDTPSDAINAQMVFEPGSSLFVIGKSGTSGMIDWTTGRDNQLIINMPKQFDIRNNNSNRALSVSGSNTIEILDSNLDMWKNSTNVTSTSDFAHNNVQSFKVSGSNIADSSETLLKSEYNGAGGQIRRIMGLNTEPTFIWQRQLTDADKKLDQIGRVRLGMIPDDSGLDENGDLSFIPMYARKGQATAKVTDSKNTFAEKELTTEDEGYLSYNIPDFYTADTILHGKAFRTGLESEVSASLPIVDITPPLPAKLTEDKIKTSTKELVGKEAEPDSTVYIDINGKRQTTSIKVAADGSWKYVLPDYLQPNDEVSVYLEDTAGKAPMDLLPVAPTTNNSFGNINPFKELPYRDAVFAPAPLYKVIDDVAAKPIITKNVKSNTLDADGNQITKVGSVLTYTITIKNNDLKNTEKVLKSARFDDVIPADLDFNLKDVKATKNDVAIPNSEFQFDGSKLSSIIGELAPQDEIVIEFPTKVKVTAVNKEISNTATISAKTSQEKEVSNEATVKNPGGTVIGELLLESAPESMDFGTVTFNSQVQTISDPIYDQGLVISDTRGAKGDGWTLYAKVETDMTHDVDKTSVLVDGFHYVSQGVDLPLNNGNKKIIGSDISESKNISDTWGTGPTDDGLKLVIDPTTSKVRQGSYTGKIVWQLMEGAP